MEFFTVLKTILTIFGNFDFKKFVYIKIISNFKI